LIDPTKRSHPIPCILAWKEITQKESKRHKKKARDIKRKQETHEESHIQKGSKRHKKKARYIKRKQYIQKGSDIQKGSKIHQKERKIHRIKARDTKRKQDT